MFHSRAALFDEEKLYKHAHSTCGPQHWYDMPINKPAALEPTNGAGTEAIPPCHYDLCDLPRVDDSGMEANLAHEYAFWVGDVLVPQTLKQAYSCPDSTLWMQIMEAEMTSLQQ